MLLPPLALIASAIELICSLRHWIRMALHVYTC